MDPLAASYPYYLPYHFAGNNPIKFIDLDGLEPAVPGEKRGERQTGTNGGNARTWEWDGKDWNEAELETAVVSTVKPREGSTRMTTKWIGSAGTGGGGGVSTMVSQYYHRGSSIYETKGGWYEMNDYVGVLGSKGLGADMAVAMNLELVTIPNPSYNERAHGFLEEIGEPAEAFYGAMGVAAKQGAAARNGYTSGYTSASGFNVEDMLLVGLVVKSAMKSLVLASPNGKFYSVAFQMELNSTKYPGGSYYSHFKEANTALDAAMVSDSKFASIINNMSIKVPRSITGNIL